MALAQGFEYPKSQLGIHLVLLLSFHIVLEVF